MILMSAIHPLGLAVTSVQTLLVHTSVSVLLVIIWLVILLTVLNMIVAVQLLSFIPVHQTLTLTTFLQFVPKWRLCVQEEQPMIHSVPWSALQTTHFQRLQLSQMWNLERLTAVLTSCQCHHQSFAVRRSPGSQTMSGMYQTVNLVIITVDDQMIRL